MTSILILEDQYTKKIHSWLCRIFPWIDFPLTHDIKDPMKYKNLIDSADIILLDNYFPGRSWWREEPLWCEVLEYLLEQKTCKKIICISDYQEVLLDKYESRKKAYEIWLVQWFVNKNISTMSAILQTII